MPRQHGGKMYEGFIIHENALDKQKREFDDKVNATVTINIVTIVNVINSDNFDNRIIVTGIVNQIVKEDMKCTNLPERYYFGSDDDMSIFNTNK